ncbi:MAG: hypothetical protein RLZZ543_949 [Bacteroidota bacterium]|jgi:hypothetical protein
MLARFLICVFVFVSSSITAQPKAEICRLFWGKDVFQSRHTLKLDLEKDSMFINQNTKADDLFQSSVLDTYWGKARNSGFVEKADSAEVELTYSINEKGKMSSVLMARFYFQLKEDALVQSARCIDLIHPAEKDIVHTGFTSSTVTEANGQLLKWKKGKMELEISFVTLVNGQFGVFIDWSMKE